MNILFFLTPKASCSYLYSDFTIRHDGPDDGARAAAGAA